MKVMHINIQIAVIVLFVKFHRNISLDSSYT
jgi:hypothetical protein